MCVAGLFFQPQQCNCPKLNTVLRCSSDVAIIFYYNVKIRMLVVGKEYFEKVKKYQTLEIIFLPAQLVPVNPLLQVHVPVVPSQVPWPEQSSGQANKLMRCIHHVSIL